MREYQSNHTGEQVDRAIKRVLQNVGKGDSLTPVYIDADGNVFPIEKRTIVEEGSEALVTSAGIHQAIVDSEEITDEKIEATEGRIDEKIDTAKSELSARIFGVETDLSNVNQTLTDKVNNLIEGKQDKLTAGEGIEITEDNVINNTNVSAEWGNITGDIDSQSDLKDKLDSLQSMVEGRTFSAVFDDVVGMNAYIAEKQAAGETIPVGFIFYIRDMNEPNYWWDGTQAIESKQQKIDLTDYTTKEYVADILTNYATKVYVDSALAEKQDKLGVIQLYKD